MIRTVYLAAGIVLASNAAHAGNSIAFNINGHHIRVTAPRHCQSLSCLQISGIDLKGVSSGRGNDGDAAARTAPQAPAAAAPSAPAAAPHVPQLAAQSQLPAAAAVAPAPVASAVPVTQGQISAAVPAPAAPAPVVAAAPLAPSAPAPVAAPAPEAQPAPAGNTAAAPDPNSPVGLWATEQNKGNVRIATCGNNLCGYAEQSGEKILINMRPKEDKWVGRIHEPESGGNYDSTITLKGPNTLRVQGCAFGGMFCGGQTWKRIG